MSNEGNAQFPAGETAFQRRSSPPTGRSYYLVGNGPRRGFGSGELWIADFVAQVERTRAAWSNNRHKLRHLAGWRVCRVRIGGCRGKSRAWLARLDRRTPLTQLPLPEVLGPVFGGDGDVFFRRREGAFGNLPAQTRGRADTQVHRGAVNSPVISPDRR